MGELVCGYIGKEGIGSEAPRAKIFWNGLRDDIKFVGLKLHVPTNFIKLAITKHYT
jgi:hypothetical protein